MLLDKKIVKEAYYGKSANLEKAELICGEIVEITQKYGRVPSRKYTIELYNSLGPLLQKEFGIKNVYVMPIDIIPNALTLPSSLRAFSRKDVNNKKRVDMSNMSINVIVSSQLIVELDLTGGELLAIILHEIGHNIDSSPFYLISFIPTIIDMSIQNGVSKLINTIALFGTTEFMKSYINFLGLLNRHSKQRTRPDITFTDTINASANTLFSYIPSITFSVAGGKLVSPAILPDKRSVTGFSKMIGEKYADSVVTSHGYGPELTSTAMKMERKLGSKATEIGMGSGPMAVIYRFNEDYLAYTVNLIQAFSLLRTHPTSITRATSQIQKLKRELAKAEAHPEMKEMILSDLKRSEEILQNMLSSEKNEYTSKYIFSTFVNKLLLDTTGGKTTLLDLFDKYIED